jgi:glycosyltransferase involved in cell wall biosynthesis
MSETLILCEYPTLNGGEWSMLATLDGVRAGGFSPTVIAPFDGRLAMELAARGIELIPFQYWGADGTRIAQSRLREQLAEILRHRRPALLHANSLAMGRLSGPVAADCGLPSIAHLRDIVRLSAQAVADLNRHRRLLAVSAATREFHVAVGLDAEKTHVLYNGVNLDEFHPRRPTGYLHRELALPGDAQLIGNIGQIGLRKGQDVLLQAAEMVDHSHGGGLIENRVPTGGADIPVCHEGGVALGRQECLPHRAGNVHFLFVGERNSDKEESRQYEEKLRVIAGSRLAGRVHFLGRRDDVPLLLNELTLLAHAARQEPLGRVLLEAAASGLAVVASDVGGTREIFPQRTAARLFPPDDAAWLAAAMLELLGKPPLRDRLGAAARQCAEERFDIRKTVGELLRHYEDLRL